MCVWVLFCSLFAFLVLSSPYLTFSRTHIPGTILSRKRNKQKSPYLINREIKITHGKKLIVEPAVKVILSDFLD